MARGDQRGAGTSAAAGRRVASAPRGASNLRGAALGLFCMALYAGHDAILLARRVPTAMVFIPCVDGLSHNEAEDALPDDVTRGTNVLLHAVLARAGVASGVAVAAATQDA